MRKLLSAGISLMAKIQVSGILVWIVADRPSKAHNKKIVEENIDNFNGTTVDARGQSSLHDFHPH